MSQLTPLWLCLSTLDLHFSIYKNLASYDPTSTLQIKIDILVFPLLHGVSGTYLIIAYLQHLFSHRQASALVIWKLYQTTGLDRYLSYNVTIAHTKTFIARIVNSIIKSLPVWKAPVVYTYTYWRFNNKIIMRLWTAFLYKGINVYLLLLYSSNETPIK